jgi:predicted nuclease with TOPRIM domain
LPEGAKLQTLTDTLAGASYGIGKNVFQERVVMEGSSMFSLVGFSVGLSYDYNPFWSAFRPTLWVTFLTVIGIAVVLVLRRPRAPAPTATSMGGLGLRPEYVKSFVDGYTEKKKVTAEIDSLESKAQKGRIPRRRYKVQRKTLETQLDTLSRNLAELKEKMRGAGGHYANLMRTLEVAETEINEVDANVKSIEARHSRGEISLETYRKLLGDYQRRKERIETTVDGILLRLREEIR